jgi:hypothetical protein
MLCSRKSWIFLDGIANTEFFFSRTIKLGEDRPIIAPSLSTARAKKTETADFCELIKVTVCATFLTQSILKTLQSFL